MKYKTMEFGIIKLKNVTSISVGCFIILLIMLFLAALYTMPIHYMFNFWLKYAGKPPAAGYGVCFLLGLFLSPTGKPAMLMLIGAFATFIFSYFV